MRKNTKQIVLGAKIAIAIVLLIMLGGAIVHSHKPTVQTEPTKLILHSKLQRKILDRIGEEDGGRAKLSYNRRRHVLHFLILNTQDEMAFKHGLMKRQAKAFAERTNTNDVTTKLTISKKAKRRQAIQRKENHEQKIANLMKAKRDKEKKQRQDAQKKENRAIQNKIKRLAQKEGLKQQKKNNHKHVNRRNKRKGKKK